MKITTKLLILFVLLFIFLVIFIFIFSNMLKRQLIDVTRKDLEQVIHSVHSSTVKISETDMADKEFLEILINEAKKDESVNEISIIGSNQEVIASSNPKRLGNKNPIHEQIMVVNEQFGIDRQKKNHNNYVVTVPIIRNNKVVGLIKTSFVTSDLSILLNSLFIRDLLIGIIILFILFFITYLTLKKINKPITVLCKAAERIARGESNVSIPYKSSDEIGQLINSFNQMTVKLNELRSMETKIRQMETQAVLSETAATLAHEIRNPLNLLNLTVDHLVNEYQPDNEKQRKSYLELMSNVKNETQHLNHMVSSFLTLGKPVELKKNQFKLFLLIKEIELFLMHQLIQMNSSMDIQVDESTSIIADREQMRMVFINLILNAMQSTTNRLHIIIKAYEKSSEIIITISDDGPGIPRDDIEKLFEPYFSTKPEGTGLGLPLVKRIVEAHQGKISAYNMENGGACFEIIIPKES